MVNTITSHTNLERIHKIYNLWILKTMCQCFFLIQLSPPRMNELTQDIWNIKITPKINVVTFSHLDNLIVKPNFKQTSILSTSLASCMYWLVNALYQLHYEKTSTIYTCSETYHIEVVSGGECGEVNLPWTNNACSNKSAILKIYA